MCMCHGGGAISCWLLRTCVEMGTSMCPTLANPGNSFGTAGSRVVESLGVALCWTIVTTTTIGQMVDTRVLGKVDKWNSSGKAWPKWSFVMKAYDVAVDQQLSGAEISTDVVSNVQLGGVQLYVVLIMLRTGRDWNRIANALRRWSTDAWRFLFQTYFPKSDARLVVLMMVVLAVLLDTNDVVAEA